MNEPPLVWDDGHPRSSRFGDIYYSLEDGLAETRAVFLAGCGLPDAWTGRRHFVVGELGFGTGLNIAALLQLWEAHRPDGGHLQVFSIEAYPPSRADAARALGAWPELADYAQAILAQWPTRRAGFHRIDLPQWNAVIDVAVMGVADALAAWQGKADAWFLDGFSPALNPDMWSEAVLGAVAARSAPGCIAATFTVAGAVRRGLEAQGFAVSKQPGHGRKRERLEARLGGARAELGSPRVVIIGAGIAGAALARAFRAQGVEPVVLGAPDAVAASGNPGALVTPALDAGGGSRARFYAETFARACQLYGKMPEAVISTGVLQRLGDARDEARFAAVAGQDHFDPASLTLTPEGLRFEDGLVIRPGVVVPAWAGAVTGDEVLSITPAGQGWQVATGRGVLEADQVILAAGWGSAALWTDLGLLSVRGQASWAQGATIDGAQAFGGYVLPLDGGVLFGATHDRGADATDVRPQDHQRNLAQLAQVLPDLAADLSGRALEGRAAVRAAMPDRMPVAGELAPGLWVLGGLGSRGFTTAPLLGEHIAARVMGRPSPLAADLARLVEPGRCKGGTRPPLQG